MFRGCSNFNKLAHELNVNTNYTLECSKIGASANYNTQMLHQNGVKCKLQFRNESIEIEAKCKLWYWNDALKLV
jgi:hypothetical protein